MRRLLLVLLLLPGAGWTASAPTDDAPQDAAPEEGAPFVVTRPVPDSGLPEEVLERMRERLVDRASMPKQDAGSE
ncbi:hypothetical protein [Roseivivax isoporae]|uniref:Uncharacterized protein n=1 Tax=Roseivivax isoporae LMG 25204 TaxID=1449351 RepID=X7F9U8_9RHOB|nr:hypothetical protein [Roseivivax isoporae]ETX28874.1 hypothetical protein RISW2_03965 [Roseivivax isoporae LMG 25204]